MLFFYCETADKSGFGIHTTIEPEKFGNFYRGKTK